MSGDNFNGFLETFAGCVEAAGRTTCLVDANQFKMDFEKMSTAGGMRTLFRVTTPPG